MLILLSVVGYTFFGSPVEMYRRGELRKAMAAVEDGEVTLNEIVPFAWDSVYSFGPYTTQEQMEEIMGISARRLEESPSEGMVQLVFVNGGQIVCGVCGYISKEGYSVSFDEKINFADNVVLRAEPSRSSFLSFHRNEWFYALCFAFGLFGTSGCAGNCADVSFETKI